MEQPAVCPRIGFHNDSRFENTGVREHSDEATIDFSEVVLA